MTKHKVSVRDYNAVCTPDFFGFNEKNELQYRGRLEESKMEIIPNAKKELLEAMILVSETGVMVQRIRYQVLDVQLSGKNKEI